MNIHGGFISETSRSFSLFYLEHLGLGAIYSNFLTSKIKFIKKNLVNCVAQEKMSP